MEEEKILKMEEECKKAEPGTMFVGSVAKDICRISREDVLELIKSYRNLKDWCRKGPK